MNEDTQNAVNDIRERGWYASNQGLGNGGWPAVDEFAADWKQYVLVSPEVRDIPHELMKITAKDDETAIAVFREHFNTAGCRAYERVVTIRDIEL